MLRAAFDPHRPGALPRAMSAVLTDWLHLILRWTHVIAAIMWIGDSFLFMWMDRALHAPTRPREGEVAGELWLVHSGGFYEVVKRRRLAPGEMPETLHWFKWEAYTTWLSGIFLLGVFYFLGRGIYLLDPARPGLGLGAGIAIAIGFLVAGWFVYDALWNSPLARRPGFAALVSLTLIALAAYALTHLFSGRAAYVLLGATLGTIMAGNVSEVIVPAQKKMIEPNTGPIQSMPAKLRS